jgi:large subunit ribosomal protein L17
MRHGNKNNNLSRTASHRRALLMNLGCQLITYKRITTTVAKAKALRSYIEPLITKTKATESKEAISHNHRIVFSYLNDKAAVKELFTVVAPKVIGRPGGYTRIIKLGARQGDNAEMAMIELVDFNEIYNNSKVEGAEPAKKTRRSGGAKKATVTSTTTEAAVSTDANVISDAVVVEETVATPVLETAAPIVEAVAAPIVEVAPVIEEVVAAPIVEEVAAPVVEASPIVEEVVAAPVVEETAPLVAAASTSTSTDDLTIIEGIGPKAAEVLIAAGIDTFVKLANTPADAVKEILTSATARVGHLDPTTWAQQSQLAADGNMEELEALKLRLNNGKEV